MLFTAFRLSGLAALLLLLSLQQSGVHHSAYKQLTHTVIGSGDTTIKPAAWLKLPLQVMKSDQDTASYYVIMFSGDGGWGYVMHALNKSLLAHGVSVVGINTKIYFHQKKTPVQLAGDIQLLMDNYGNAWNKKKVVLIGYSFSAEVLPFAYNSMDTVYRDQVRQVILLAPSPAADFKVAPLFIYRSAHSTPLLPELNKINPERMLILCDGTRKSLCNVLPPGNPFQLVMLNCNHLLLGHRAEVAKIITGFLAKKGI